MEKIYRILYISYDGLLEPLGQSQILSYMENISEEFKISIVSFEKKNDWKKKENVQIVKNIILKSQIDWIHLNYTSKPYIFSTLLDITKGIIKSLILARHNKIDIIHARGDIAGIIAYLISFFLNIKFIFDMRGFWADERFEWGIWKRKNIIYYFFKWLEYKLIKKSDAIVSLTKVGIDEILLNINHKQDLKDYQVIPTCTNLKLFTPNNHKNNNQKFTLTHLGAISTRYEFQKVIDIYKIIDSIISSDLLIINKGEHEFVKQLLNNSFIEPSKYKILEANYVDVPYYINISSAGVFFPKDGNYLKGYFPTKLGEFLACGKPVICSKINNDVENIILENNVGIVIDNNKPEKLKLASKKIIELASNEKISKHCREVSKKYFSNINGSEKYKELYLKLMKKK